MTQPETLSGEQADLLSTAVLTCAGVAGMSGGMFGEVATYLPGRRVTGIRSSRGALEVHVEMRWGVHVPELVSDIRRACAEVVPERRIDVYVDDVVIPTPATVAPSIHHEV